MQPTTSKGDRVSSFDADFDGFTSCKPINHPPTPNLNLAPVFDFSSQSSSNVSCWLVIFLKLFHSLRVFSCLMTSFFQSPICIVAPLNIPTSPHPNQILDPSESFDEVRWQSRLLFLADKPSLLGFTLCLAV